MVTWNLASSFTLASEGLPLRIGMLDSLSLGMPSRVVLRPLKGNSISVVLPMVTFLLYPEEAVPETWENVLVSR